MATQSLTKSRVNTASVFDDFFKPWNEWFGNGDSEWPRALSVPAVNIIEEKNEYQVALAVPGMQKEDFKIDIEGSLLTISSEKEVNKEEKEQKFTRKEYSYSSFSRSFTLPDEVNKEKIEAKYEEGVLKIVLPRKEAAKKNVAKQIAVE